MSAQSYTYLDRQGLRINPGKWLKLQADDSYRTIRQFDNGTVQVSLFWVGKLTRLQASSFRDTWPVFSARVFNYKADGTISPDPVDDNRTFHDEESALDWYEEFLTCWTDSTIDDNGNLVEVDNLLAPPPPPDPDAPTSTAEDVKGLPDDLGAAW